MQRISETNRLELGRVTEDISTQNENLELVSQRLDKLEQLMDLNEADLKCCNLRFLGIPEGGTTNFPAADLIIDILNQYSYQRIWNSRDLNRAHRVGEWREDTDNPRPIVVQMHRWSDKMEILQDQEMREALRKDNIRIASELTTRQRGMVDFHTRQGKRAYYWKGRLQVEERQEKFSRERFPVRDANHARLHDHRRSQRHFRDTWPDPEEGRVDRHSNRRHDRYEEPRVVPGQKSYSQVVREGRSEARSPVAGIQSTKNFPHRRQHEASSSSGYDRRSGRGPHRETLSRDERRGFHYQEKDHTFPRPKDKVEVPRRKSPVHSSKINSPKKRILPEPSVENKKAKGGNQSPQISAEREAEGKDCDDQLSDHSSESDPPTTYVDEINSDIPPQDLPSCIGPSTSQMSRQRGINQDKPTVVASPSQMEQDDSREQDRSAAAPESEDRADSSHTQKCDTAQGVENKDQDEAEDHSTLEDAVGQAETIQEAAVSSERTERQSRPTARNPPQEKRLTRMSARAGDTKERSCSQSNIKEAFKKINTGGGSHSKERDKIKERSTSSHNQLDNNK